MLGANEADCSSDRNYCEFVYLADMFEVKHSCYCNVHVGRRGKIV